MDAETGRILYEKDGETRRPMASTTKIMTCILALELGSGKQICTASANAVAQPQVKLGMREAEQFYLQDLLYSLMLKSHNDTAVAIAEHIGGSVKKFAAREMNQKAKELGCTDTHFVTPNGSTVRMKEEGIIRRPGSGAYYGLCSKEQYVCSYHPDQIIHFQILPERNIIQFIIQTHFWIWRQV